MLEIVHAFRGSERRNERSDGSMQSFDGARSSLAQQSLHGMEYQLDWIKVRRILRQVSEAGANAADCLFHAGNLMEGDIVGYDNISTLERRRQTLLYVSQKCLAVHRPFNEHRGDDASLTQASNERHRLPVPHGRVRDQAFAAGAPAVKAHHIGGHRRFVDKYEAGRVKQALLANPASARASHIGALALLRPQGFF
jgi:hypothetical protein